MPKSQYVDPGKVFAKGFSTFEPIPLCQYSKTLAEEKIPVTAVGIKDRFGEVGKLPYLRETMGLTVEEIVKAAKKAVSLK